MKRLLLLAMTVVALSACVSEQTDWGGDESLSSENVGYLSFGEDGIQVYADYEEGAGDVEHQASASHAPVTRAGVDTSNYTVRILKSDGSQAIPDFKLGELPSLENYREAGYTNNGRHPELATAGLELPVGTYTVYVFSAEAANQSNEPEYVGSATATLRKGVATSVTVNCTLSSVKVTVTFDPILADVLDATKTSVMARLDEEGVASPSAYTWGSYADKAALILGHDQVTPVYLKPQVPSETGSPLNIYLTTIYGGTEAAGTGSQINAQKLPVGNVKAGEWRKVTVKLDHGTDGTVFFVVTVETWVHNNAIDVTQAVYAASLGEMEIPDVTDAPVIETPVGGLDLTQPLTLSGEMFTNGAYNGDASMTIKTKQPIKALYLSATSDSEGLPELISFMGLDAAGENGFNGLDLAGTLNAGVKAIVNTWGFPTSNVAGQNEIPFSIAGLLSQLHTEPSYTGKHTFSLTIVDVKGNNATYTLQVTSGIIQTDIVWLGKNIDQRYDIYAGGGDPTKIEIKVTAATGIKSLHVEIIGPLSGIVSDVGLSPKFDLVDPKNDLGQDISSPLVGLNFPVGNDVKDKQSISFDITSFIDLLSVAIGENSFKLTLVENDGNSLEKTVMINVIDEEYPF